MVDRAHAGLAAREAFEGRADWYALDMDMAGVEIVLVSTPGAGVDARLVRLSPKDGYVVSRIRVSCPHGGYAVRDARQSSTDAKAPATVSKGTPGLPLSMRLSQICSRTARLPTFPGRLDVAVRRLRALNSALAQRASAPPPGDVARPVGDAVPGARVFSVDASGHAVERKDGVAPTAVRGAPARLRER